MSRANPEKALAAILPLAIDCGEGIVVRPMTLGMWAALERIKSPLVTGEDAKDALDLVPSLYLLTHDPREVLRGDLFDAALEWADTVSVDAMHRIHATAARQQLAVFDVIPEAKKRNESGNDGWIAAWVHRAAHDYGWSYEQILWETPTSALALLMRNDKLDRIFPLSEIKKIDHGKKTKSRAGARHRPREAEGAGTQRRRRRRGRRRRRRHFVRRRQALPCAQEHHRQHAAARRVGEGVARADGRHDTRLRGPSARNGRHLRRAQLRGRLDVRARDRLRGVDRNRRGCGYHGRKGARALRHGGRRGGWRGCGRLR